jgi:V/A-type H+-transporting ATPase subunit E
MAEFLREIIGRWSPSGGDIPGLEVLLPQAQQERLSGALESALCRELAGGLSLRFTKAVRAGFQVQPGGSSYKISLTDEDFREYFREYLRPRMRAFLFGE